MSKRSSKPRSRALAAPIVMTVLAPACSERVYRNPGPPERVPVTAEPTSTATAAETAAPSAAPSSSAPIATDLDSLRDAPPGWDLERNADGSCTAIPKPMQCPPTATCNPAPPFRVKCPPSMPEVSPPATATPATALPPAPSDKAGSLQKKPDGTCWFRATPACKPTQKCNPGPPFQVQCPDVDPAKPAK
ncbi:MAG: hypothetical protein JNL21_36765 [Myxococcales bacterium]|nr:hypothetical protein [Myxococcales bacterium]